MKYGFDGVIALGTLEKRIDENPWLSSIDMTVLGLLFTASLTQDYEAVFINAYKLGIDKLVVLGSIEHLTAAKILVEKE